MNKWLMTLACVAVAVPAAAEVSYLSCEVGTMFYKPAPNNTEWAHREGNYTKIFKLDSDARMVSLYNRREGSFAPICSASNAACSKSWIGSNISINGTGAPDAPVPPYLDFRRTVSLRGNELIYTVGDYGVSGKQNMRWVMQGSCKSTSEPAPVARRGGGPPAGAPGMRNPNYVDSGVAMAVPEAEAKQALAGYFGNTMWGFSGGKHWFHMWFLEGTLAYTGDEEDITGEGKPRNWFVGKDAQGYRLCPQAIPAAGMSGCYPLPVRTLGEAWVQQDMDGPAYFSLLPGRQ